MSSDDTQQSSLICADGYSYTEIIHTPQPAGMPAGSTFVTIFHPFFTSPKHETELAEQSVTDAESAT